MNNFSISFKDDIRIEFGEEIAVGTISLNNYKEEFYSPLVYWKIEDYQKQWQEGINKAFNKENSALIISMYDLKKANFIKWWLMYNDGENIIFQDNILFLKKISSGISINKIYDYIPEYRQVNKDNEKISEWHLNIEDISNFKDFLEK